LQEVHARRVAGDRDAKEVVETSHVGHGKLGTKRSRDPVEELR
jgi:hypothetical protein